jgi:hypothetical protein
VTHHDDDGFVYSSDADWDREGARERGAGSPELAWILSDRDVWYPNPFYCGPAQPHPDDYPEDHPEDDPEDHPEDHF